MKCPICNTEMHQMLDYDQYVCPNLSSRECIETYLTTHEIELVEKALSAARAEGFEQARPALLAAEQCMADLVEVYQRRASNIVIEQAVFSVKDDGLKKVRAALKATA